MSDPKPSLTFRLAARSVPQTFAKAEAVVSRLGLSRAITFRGRKFSNEAFLNGLVEWFATLPEDQQDAVLRDGVARYEAILSGSPAPAAPPAPAVVVREVLPPKAAEKPPARRRGAG